MSRVIAIAACGFVLAACSMSMPSFDFFRAGPATEVLRIESEPPGADARTAEGQSCRTPCELTVPSSGEVPISFALQGYQPQTISVRAEGSASSYADAGPSTRLQPNPVYAELTPASPQRQQKKKATAKKKVAAKRSVAPSSADPGPPPSQTQGAADPSNAYPSNYPWPPPPPQ